MDLSIAEQVAFFDEIRVSCPRARPVKELPDPAAFVGEPLCSVWT